MMNNTLLNTLAPHDQLLVQCLRSDSSREELRSIMREMPQASLHLFVESAFRQGVSTLLYSRFRKLSLLDLFPSALSGKLQSAYLGYAARITGLYYDLEQVGNVFDREGIEWIVLKGAHLAGTVYENPAQRIMCDIDLLVKKRDVERAGNLLVSKGFGTPDFVTPGEEHCDISPSHHVKPLLNKRRTCIELHFALAKTATKAPIPPDCDTLFEHAEWMQLNNTRARVLCPEDLLIHLALHLVKHRFDQRLKALYDIHAVLVTYRDRIGWETLLERAAAWNQKKSVLLTLMLAKTLFDSPVPNEVLNPLNNVSGEEMLKLAFEALFSEHLDSSLSLTGGILSVRGVKGILQALRLAADKLFLTRELIASMYGLPPDTPLHRLYARRAQHLLSMLRFALRQRYLAGNKGGQNDSLLIDRNIDRVITWLRE